MHWFFWADSPGVKLQTSGTHSSPRLILEWKLGMSVWRLNLWWGVRVFVIHWSALWQHHTILHHQIRRHGTTQQQRQQHNTTQHSATQRNTKDNARPHNATQNPMQHNAVQHKTQHNTAQQVKAANFNTTYNSITAQHSTKAPQYVTLKLI